MRPSRSSRAPQLPSPQTLGQWASGGLVILAGWGAGRGLAVGMDTAHCAATGFAISGSIGLAMMLFAPATSARRSTRP